MGLIKTCDLYPHLSSEYIKMNEKFSKDYDVNNLVTESDRLLYRNLNEEADLLNPVSAFGHRVSDIDSINLVEDIRLQNILMARLHPLGQDIQSNLSDEQLLDVVIRRNMTTSEVSAYADEYNYLKEESKRLYDEYIANQEKQNAYVPETTTQ